MTLLPDDRAAYDAVINAHTVLDADGEWHQPIGLTRPAYEARMAALGRPDLASFSDQEIRDGAIRNLYRKAGAPINGDSAYRRLAARYTGCRLWGLRVEDGEYAADTLETGEMWALVPRRRPNRNPPVSRGCDDCRAHTPYQEQRITARGTFCRECFIKPHHESIT